MVHLDVIIDMHDEDTKHSLPGTRVSASWCSGESWLGIQNMINLNGVHGSHVQDTKHKSSGE